MWLLAYSTVLYRTQRAIILAERRSRKIESIRLDSTRYRAIRADARARRRRNWGRESSRRRARACHQRAGDRSLSLLFDIFGFRYCTVLYCTVYIELWPRHMRRLGSAPREPCRAIVVIGSHRWPSGAGVTLSPRTSAPHDSLDMT